MKNVSAGLLMYRNYSGEVEYFLVHPGGPFFYRRDEGVWTIPKGLLIESEHLLEAAQREFREETGLTPTAPFHHLGNVKQKGGKIVHAWAFSGSWNPETGIVCNTFDMEWPPRSGKKASFPEVDKAAWFTYSRASSVIIPEQRPFLERARELFQ